MEMSVVILFSASANFFATQLNTAVSLQRSMLGDRSYLSNGAGKPINYGNGAELSLEFVRFIEISLDVHLR